MKEQFRLRDFIKICVTEWKAMAAATIVTIIKSIGLPFYSILFGSYIAVSYDFFSHHTLWNLVSLFFL